MGCDIHPRVEEKKPDGKWVDITDFLCLHYPEVITIINHRNYTVFSVLANVRNNGDINPIDDPRGFPEDSIYYGSEYTGYKIPQPKGQLDLLSYEEGYSSEEDDTIFLGDHSHSWVGLEELLDYDWDQTFEDSGWVDMESYRSMGKVTIPKSWCGDIGGGGVEKVTNEEMDRLCATYLEGTQLSKHFYTYVTWKVSYREYTADFVAAINRLHKFIINPNNLRLIFGFDS